MSEPYVLRITFGDQYRREPHPRVEWAHPDGWFEVEVVGAPDADRMDLRESAVLLAQEHLGPAYAFDYSPESWAEGDSQRFYPLGVLARLTVRYPDGAQTLEVFRSFAPSMIERQRPNS